MEGVHLQSPNRGRADGRCLDRDKCPLIADGCSGRRTADPPGASPTERSCRSPDVGSERSHHHPNGGQANGGHQERSPSLPGGHAADQGHQFSVTTVLVAGEPATRTTVLCADFQDAKDLMEWERNAHKPFLSGAADPGATRPRGDPETSQPVSSPAGPLHDIRSGLISPERGL